MKRIVIIGADTATIARIKILLESRADVQLVDADKISDVRVTLADGRVIVGDKEYSPEDVDAWRAEAEEQRNKTTRRILASLHGNLDLEMEMADMCAQECDWADDEVAYNTSQANMMRRRDQHSATVKWQHVRPVKARKPRRNSTRGRR